MRLIDADALAEEIKENMENGFPANEYLSLYAISCIAHAPTVCDIEQIRAEIQENINYNKKMNYRGIVAGLLLTLDVINKYTAESEGIKNEL